MNVLSLFDGMSCGRIALERANISVDTYYASEVDKYATVVSEANYPDIIRLGDVTKWREWNIDWSGVDLLIAGSPCQGFSSSGKGLGFEDPRSKLFYTFVDILNHIRKHNPDVKFLLENVRMKTAWRDHISDILNVDPVRINSALVSAQNRVRDYWANWSFGQPDDKGVVLADIIDYKEQSVNSEAWHKWWGVNKEKQLNKKYSSIVDGSDKAITMTARQYACWNGNFKRVSEDIKPKILQRGHGFNKGGIKGEGGKCPSMTSSSWEHNNFVYYDTKYRRLSPIECERLQTVPDNYTNHVSDSQRYKMLGNGWTVDVIAHILSNINKPLDKCYKQCIMDL